MEGLSSSRGAQLGKKRERRSLQQRQPPPKKRMVSVLTYEKVSSQVSVAHIWSNPEAFISHHAFVVFVSGLLFKQSRRSANDLELSFEGHRLRDVLAAKERARRRKDTFRKKRKKKWQKNDTLGGTCHLPHPLVVDSKLLLRKQAASAELFNFFRSASEPASALSLDYAEPPTEKDCRLWFRQRREEWACRIWYPFSNLLAAFSQCC